MQKKNKKICQNCGRELKEMSLNYMGITIPVKCQCQIEKEEKERQIMIKQGYERLQKEVSNNSGISKKYKEITLDNIIPLAKQKDGFKMAVEFASKRLSHLDDIKGFALFGGVGSGKTYITAALVNTLCNAVIEETTEDERINAYKGVFKLKPPARFISHIELLETLKEDDRAILKYKNAQILVIDDLGAARNTEWASERLLEIIDYRYNRLLPIIFTTNIKPVDLKEKISNRTFDRLTEMCDFVGVTAQSQRNGKNEK